MTENVKYSFRFDDVSINSDMGLTNAIAEVITDNFEYAEVIYAVSPLVASKTVDQRIFPKIWNAKSDYTEYYKMTLCGIPPIPEGICRASHSLIHVDHRLLSYEAQELSIVTSCYLADTRIFVPPFNKWNNDTELICDKHNIELIKWEDGWLCAEYNQFDPTHDKWYLHAREFTLEQFERWINQE